MNILITGGTGFIGSHTAKFLLKQDPKHHVVLFDVNPTPALLGPIVNEVKVVRGDASDFAQVSDAIRAHQIDYIVHLAALMQAPPLQMMRVNCVGTTNILEAAHLNKVKRVVYASSVGIFQNKAYFSEEGLVGEDAWPRPTTMYGACKEFNEVESQVYRANFGLESVGMRFGGVFGNGRVSRPGIVPGTWLDGIGLAAMGKPFVMPSDSQFVGWVHVEDLAQAIACALFAKSLPQYVYNVSAGASPISDWTKRIKGAFPAAQMTVSPRPIETSQLLKPNAIADELGFKRRYSVETAITAYLDAIREGRGTP